MYKPDPFSGCQTPQTGGTQKWVSLAQCAGNQLLTSGGRRWAFIADQGAGKLLLNSWALREVRNEGSYKLTLGGDCSSCPSSLPVSGIRELPIIGQ